jgi:hypothetical protein
MRLLWKWEEMLSLIGEGRFFDVKRGSFEVEERLC